MKTLHVFLIILLVIVIIAASMRSYKIETFITLTNTDAYPQTPNNETCYDYIKNVKKWNVDELTKEQQKVLFTMRAIKGIEFSNDTKLFPFKNGCAIPREHLSIFNKNENANSLTVYPKNKSPITLNSTDATMTPNGIYADFTDSTMTFDKFKNILSGGYLLYDSDFLLEKTKLETQIKRLTSTRDNLKTELARLVTVTKNTNEDTALLLNPNSLCQQTKKYNVTILLPEWNKFLGINNNIVRRINQLWSHLWSGWTQIWQLQRCG